MSVNSKMTAIADEIRTLSGTTDSMGLDAMASTLNTENTNFFSNLTTQDDLIAQIQTALADKASAGSADPVLQSKTVTPSADEQIITADSGYDGLDTVTVEGDVNLVAENIVSGVSIFGIAGSASTGGSGGSSAQTAIVTVTIDAPLDLGTETLYYIGPNGYGSVNLGYFAMDSTTITCTNPSIIATDSQYTSFTPSSTITKLANNVYYVAGNGSLYYG